MWIVKLLTDLTILSLSAGIVFFLYSIYEFAAVMRMKEWVYRTGWTSVNLTEPLTRRPENTTPTGTRAAGCSKYRFVSVNSCLFRERWQPSHLLRMQSAVPIKGEIVFLGDKAVIRGRAPLGMTGFYIAFILGAATIEARVILERSGYVAPVILGAGILAVVAAMYTVLSGEKESFMDAYQDLKNEISSEETPSLEKR